jgi:Fur family ferric uptake transcriptional regulator
MQQDVGPCTRDCAGSKCCIEHFRDTLQVLGKRLTDERRLLMQTICAIDGHFRPEDVARILLGNGHAISVPTIYRNLPVLIEAGIIRRTDAQDTQGGSQYEHIWGHEHHDHLVCVRCRKLIEFQYPAIDALQEVVAREHGFALINHRLELLGVCAECRDSAGLSDETETAHPHAEARRA